MLDELRANNWIPKSMNKKISSVRNAHQTLEKEFGRLPDDNEITEYLGMSSDEYYKILQVASTQVTLRFEDFSERMHSEDKLDMMECISDPDAMTPLDILEENDKKEVLAGIIGELPEKEKLILSLYYWEEMTMKEIAKVLNLTEGRVCQLHSQALIRLKSKMNFDLPERKEAVTGK